MKEKGLFRRFVKGAACVLQTEQFKTPELKTIVNEGSSIVSKRSERHLPLRANIAKNNPWV